ncbi:DMT family transporter [Novosphingobium sp. M1R2S20]|uniref:DMT family transporter n=1 Tax=Novosphingobium rhizovicinum TaxID=3228928 RepID=A0ABV3RBN9_9SPHN
MRGLSSHSTRLPAVIAVVAGIATFSAMDAAIKGASLAVGVYTALLLRNIIGTALVLPFWLASKPRWPGPPILALHVLRSSVNTGMALLFFVGLVRIPMAEGMALSFIAPLIALFLAAVFLGERIRVQAVIASMLGLTGVVVIVGSRLGPSEADPEVLLGIAAVLASAVLYAVNLVLQRKQAVLASPVEITLFQNMIVALILMVFAPWLLVLPSSEILALIAFGAVCATIALSLFAWGYARAEAQVLLPLEYTAFVWAALFGWIFFAEPLSAATLAGTVLIVMGCWIGTRNPAREHTEQTAV